MNGIVGIIIIYAGIGVLQWVSNRWWVKMRFGIVGLVLVIQPVATTIYDPIESAHVLALVLLGLVILLIDASRQTATRHPSASWK